MVYFHYEWTWGESEFSKGLASTKATKNLCEYKSVYRYLKNVKKPSYFVKFEWNSISDSFKPKVFYQKWSILSVCISDCSQFCHQFWLNLNSRFAMKHFITKTSFTKSIFLIKVFSSARLNHLKAKRNLKNKFLKGTN